jgi:hypothetical protein
VEIKQVIERIASLRQSDIGPTEENVKQKVIVPLLELLGHKREDLEFEYRTLRGGKIDIFIKNVPPDCKVIIDTKNYNENLSDYVEQIKEYTFDEAALLTIIANGTEIRIYSPLRGVAFERSLLYSLKRQDLGEETVWKTLSDLLHYDNLQNRNVHKKLDVREREIKDAMAEEENLKQEYDSKIEGIDGDIKAKEEEIEQLKTEKENLTKEAEAKVLKIWDALGLPLDLFKIHTAIPSRRITSVGSRPDRKVKEDKKKKVTLQELVKAGLVRNGQILYFFHGRVFKDEQAEIVANQNKLKYKGDGKLYSISKIAEVVDIKHGFKRSQHRGPIFWQTENGKLLDDLNEQVRTKRGNRR